MYSKIQFHTDSVLGLWTFLKILHLTSSIGGLWGLWSWHLSLIYTYVGDTFETIADRNDVLVDTFNCRLEVSATKRKFYCRWLRHVVSRKSDCLDRRHAPLTSLLWFSALNAVFFLNGGIEERLAELVRKYSLPVQCLPAVLQRCPNYTKFMGGNCREYQLDCSWVQSSMEKNCVTGNVKFLLLAIVANAS